MVLVLCLCGVAAATAPELDPAYPEEVRVKLGEEAVFTVEVVGSTEGLEFEWFLDTADANDIVVGAEQVLTIDSVQNEDEGEYRCIVKETASGDASESARARLIINRMTGYWPFDGDADDATEYGNDGTVMGASFVDGLTGDALRFGADDERVSIPPAALALIDTQITLSLWTFGDDNIRDGNNAPFTAKNSGGGTLFYANVPNTTARIFWNAGGDEIRQTASSTPEIYKGRWNHWVFTKDAVSGEMAIYANGVLWHSGTELTGSIDGGSASSFDIGGVVGNYFRGVIDDVRIFNYVLTEAEIAEISPTPTLPNPADGEIGVIFNTDLSWTPSDDAVKYVVSYSDAVAGGVLVSPTVVSGLTEPVCDIPEKLSLLSTYYWQVEELDSGDNVLWTSHIWKFTTGELVGDADKDLDVDMYDFSAVAGRYMEDTAGFVKELMIDDCVYDITKTDPEDPESGKHYWRHYYEEHNGDKLYGEGECLAVDDPNAAVEWVYDASTSNSGADCGFYYIHQGRSRLNLGVYDEIHLTIKATEGSTLSGYGFWYYIYDQDGTTVNGNYSTIQADLADNEWHEIVINIGNIGNIESITDLDRIKMGMWQSGITGSFLIKDFKAVSTKDSMLVVDDGIYDPAIVDPENADSGKHYWRHYYEEHAGDQLYGTGECLAVSDPNAGIEWIYDASTSNSGADCGFYYIHQERPRLNLGAYNEIHLTIKATEGSTLSGYGFWYYIYDRDGTTVNGNYSTIQADLADNEWHEIVINIGNIGGIEGISDLDRIKMGMWQSGITGSFLIKDFNVVNTDGSRECVAEFYVNEDFNYDCIIDMQDLLLMAGNWLLDANP